MQVASEARNFQVQQFQFTVQMRALKPGVASDLRHLAVFVGHQAGQIGLFEVVAQLFERTIEVERDVGAGNLQHRQRFEALWGWSDDNGFLRFFLLLLVAGKRVLALPHDQSVLHRREQLLHGNGLFEERQRAESDGFDSVFDGAVTAHHDDGAVQQSALSPFLEQGDAVRVGHPDIQQNQVVLVLQHKNAGRFCAVGCVDGMAFISENVREHFSDTKFVIDDKDF